MAEGRRQVLLRCVATTAMRPADVDRDLALLDDAERPVAERFASPEDRRDYAAAHALLRRTLSLLDPATAPSRWRFGRTPGGKPFVLDPRGMPRSLPFSLSHARGLVACAAGGSGALGLDVEGEAAFDLALLVPDVCSADEAAQLQALDGPRRTARFLDLWTLKEAYAKARGIGIGAGPTGFSFDLRSAGRVSARLPADAATGWGFTLFEPAPGSRLALAVERTAGPSPSLDAALVERDGSLLTLRATRTGTQAPG